MRPLTFLTDYGHDDDFVGVCHGVIARLAPDVRVIDITHGIPRHEVRGAALVLRNTLPYMPVGVHLVVVDPEVGSQRRAVAIETGEGHVLVGPDNGVLALAAERLGGAVAAADVSHSPWRLEPVSATFHGRDVFAPIAARLADGGTLAEAGEPLPVGELTPLELPRPEVRDGALVVHALYVDRFGNVALDATHDDITASGLKLGQQLALDLGGEPVAAQYAGTFADVPEGGVLVYEDAYRTLAIAVNRGDAALALGIAPDDEIGLRVA